MSVQASSTSEFRFALGTFELFLVEMSLQVTGQGFLVLEGCTALLAREGFVGIPVEIFVDRQMVFARKRLVAKLTREFKICLMSALMPL